MFVTKKSLPRRTFLRGAGAVVALPFLESMVPAMTAHAQAAAYRAAVRAKPDLEAALLPIGHGLDVAVRKVG